MQGKKKLIAFLAFAMYFLTGAACIVVGSSLPHLVKLYNMDLEKVVLSNCVCNGKIVNSIFHR